MLLAYAAITFEPVNAATTSQPPQVFVRDANVQADTGDNPHDAGLRTPTDNDPDSAPLSNAHGTSIKTLLGIWRTAVGTLTFDPAPQGVNVRAVFHLLIPNGRYSLFVRQLAVRTGAVYTPLDVVGAENSFTADPQGNGQLAITTPLQLGPGVQIVLVFHSDGVDHQSSLGNPGVNAHAQLITRVP